METRIYFRALEPSDLPTTLKWRQDRQLWDNLVGPHHFVSSVSEKDWLEQCKNSKINVRLAICLKEGDAHIGNIYLSNIDYINRTGEIGLLLGQAKFRGRGFGTEALRLMVDYAFRERDLVRLSARVFSENAASNALFEKVGFKKEGVLRQAIYKSGDRKDLNIYGLLRDEYTRK